MKFALSRDEEFELKRTCMRAVKKQYFRNKSLRYFDRDKENNCNYSHGLPLIINFPLSTEKDQDKLWEIYQSIHKPFQWRNTYLRSGENPGKGKEGEIFYFVIYFASLLHR